MLVRCCRQLVRKWETLQVELHGEYSTERMFSLQLFQYTTSPTRAVVSVILTPLPCLLASALVEGIPLDTPEKGIRHSQMFWLRGFICYWVLTYMMLVQCQTCIIDLPMTSAQMISVSLINAVASILWSFGLACWLGFPVPFTITLSAPCACMVMAVALNVVWGRYFREAPALKKELQFYGLVLATQLAFTYVYPVYTFGFNQFIGFTQSAFALLLPVLKIVAKNWMGYLMREKHDSKPESVVFHVEVFHALFLASCLQNSTSYTTLVVLMGVDFGVACISLHDVCLVLDSIHQVVKNKARSHVDPDAAGAKDAYAERNRSSATAMVNPRDESWRSLHYLEAAIFLLQHDSSLLQDPLLNRRSTHKQLPRVERLLASTTLGRHQKEGNRVDQNTLQQPKTSQVSPEPNRQELKDHEMPSCKKTQQQRLPQPTRQVFPLCEPDSAQSYLTANLTEEHKRFLLSMRYTRRIAFVQQVLNVLYMTEFLLLVEFIEVVVPVVYSIYLGLVFYLPNRVYYDELRDIDAVELLRNIVNVLVYGLLEACSLVFLSVVLQHKLHFSSLHQLAFVLETQWQHVQSKLVFWVLFAVQAPLAHFGVDFSFQFAWLKTSIPAP
uniref:Uncharacterized protein n=1 Tax=Globisporangium ultimum (strain ATCC 200006 / CBS 805.95 / DAOM BR144) TaxID=431595 RepID=K3X2L9_GLOUD